MKVGEGVAATNGDVRTKDDDKYYLIVTHNNRLQSWIDEFIGGKEKVRFSNCAALKMEVDSNGSFTFELLHNGDYSSNKTGGQKYWVKSLDDFWQKCSETAPKEVSIKGNSLIRVCSDFDKLNFVAKLFDKKESSIQNTAFKDLNIKNLVEKKFIIVRHGEMNHNFTQAINIQRDTNLTLRGKEQARKLGQKLKDDKSIQLHKEVFISDLKRTFETAKEILEADPKVEESLSDYKFVVLPCAHEVMDEKGAEKGLLAHYENTTSCILKKNTDNRVFCEQWNTGSDQLNIDWDYYVKTYRSGDDNVPLEKMKRGKELCLVTKERFLESLNGYFDPVETNVQSQREEAVEAEATAATAQEQQKDVGDSSSNLVPSVVNISTAGGVHKTLSKKRRGKKSSKARKIKNVTRFAKHSSLIQKKLSRPSNYKNDKSKSRRRAF